MHQQSLVTRLALTITALLSLSSMTIASDSNTCPDGKTPEQVNSTPICCKNNQYMLESSATYCIVGCTKPFKACFPFCAGGPKNQQTTVGSCTSVSVDDPNYTSLVYGDAGATTGTSSSSSESSESTSSDATSATQGSDGGSTVAAMTETTSSSSSSSTSGSSNAGVHFAAVTEAPILALAGCVAGLAAL